MHLHIEPQCNISRVVLIENKIRKACCAVTAAVHQCVSVVLCIYQSCRSVWSAVRWWWRWSTSLTCSYQDPPLRADGAPGATEDRSYNRKQRGGKKKKTQLLPFYSTWIHRYMECEKTVGCHLTSHSDSGLVWCNCIAAAAPTGLHSFLEITFNVNVTWFCHTITSRITLSQCCIGTCVNCHQLFILTQSCF